MNVSSRSGVFAGIFLVCGFCVNNSLANAQFAGPSVSAAPLSAEASAAGLKPEYMSARIVPGDTISISTYGVPELTTNAKTASGSIVGAGGGQVEGFKVNDLGEVQLPYLGSVKLAGMTPAAASTYLSNALKDGGYLVDPQLSVQIADSPTHVISVVGEVLKPSPVSAVGQIRLLDAVSFCGGFTPLASHVITIRRPGYPDPIIVELGVDPKTTTASEVMLMAGDTVIVPRVGNVFVVGEVKTENAYPLSGNAPITVMRAISLAGGLKYGAALSKARIIRSTTGNQHVEIMLDLKKIMDGKQQDVALASDDVLYIPSNAFKAALVGGGAGVATSVLYGAAYAYTATK